MEGNEERSQSADRVVWWGLRVARASVALVAIIFLVSGCGGSNAPSVATPGAATTTAGKGSSGSVGAASSGSTAPGSSSRSALAGDELAFAKCMRSNGVPNFPDPNAGGGFPVVGIDHSSAAFKAAQAKCQKLLPGGGPGSGPSPSPQTMAQWLGIAQCMRRHGVPGFPDPTTTVPPLSPGIGEISDRDGAILVFPRTLDTQSPLFLRAAAKCGFQLTNH